MDIYKLVDSLFCINCKSINILTGDINCSEKSCNCIMNSKFDTLLEMFANLYYQIDGTNYINFISEITSIEPSDLLSRVKEINQKWNFHMSKNPYNSNEYKYLNSKTLQIIKEDLREQVDKISLLIRVVLWIRRIDNHLDVLFDYLENEIIREAYFNTKRGILLLRLKSKIAEHIFNERKIKPHSDPNKLKLKHDLNSMYLSKLSYNSYPNVKHKNMNFGVSKDFKNNTIEDLKIAFLSGDFSIDEYTWCIEDNDSESKYFHFKGLNDEEEYYKVIEAELKVLLESNPHFIILPELFTPVNLQEKIQKEIDTYYENKIMSEEPFNLLMVLPGSFHLKSDQYIYNISRIINSSGDLVENIYKHNKFTIDKDENYSGVLEPFKQYNGIERISYSKRDITIFDTSLGRIAVLICIDFIIDDVVTVLEDRLVDIVFVMAMTPMPNGGKFKRKYQELSEKNKAVVIIGNNSQKSVKNLISLPGMKEPFTNKNSSGVIALKELFT